MKDDMERIIITLDNVSVHTSLNTKRLFEYLNFQASFLTLYSPKLATVELFSNIIKAKIRSLWAEIDIDFSKNSGRDWIFTAVKDIQKKHNVKLWIQIMNQLKLWLTCL